MNYQLVILDLDGTILFRDGTITPRVRQTIKKVLQSDVKLTLATGRVFPVTQKIAQSLGVTLPLICAQGAVVQDPLTGRRLWYQAIPENDVHDLLDFAEAHGVHMNIYQDEYTYTSRHSPDLELYKTFGPGQIRIIHDLRSHFRGEAIKALFVCRAENQAEYEHTLREVIPPHLQVIRTHDFFVEVVAKAASKGQAAAFLAEKLGVRPEYVLAIGDHENDLDLITWAGTGIAMGDGYDRLKSWAQWVAPALVEDGAAVALERFLDL